jgi:hypothetical protein
MAFRIGECTGRNIDRNVDAEVGQALKRNVSFFG